MAVTINASTSAGLVQTADTSGVLQLQTNSGTTALTIDTSQRAAFVAGTAALPAITTTGDTNTGMFFPAADTIAFTEGGTEAMRLDSSGKLLVGTTTAASGGGVVQTIVGSGSNDGGIQVTSGTGVSGGGLAMNSLAGGGAKFFSFTGNAGSESYTERMRIDSSGYLLVGCTSAPSSSVSGVQWSNPTSIQSKISTGSGTGAFTAVAFYNGNGQVGRIDTSGSSTVYVTSSDYRLKENIAPMTGALDKVALLKPVTYKWKIDGKSGDGFIAHELAEVCSDAVVGEKDAIDKEGEPLYQGIDTSFLVATLTAAIQEMKAIIDAQSARITALENK